VCPCTRRRYINTKMSLFCSLRVLAMRSAHGDMHTYANLPQSTAALSTTGQDFDHESGPACYDSAVRCLPDGYCCMGTACIQVILYAVCIALDAISMAYKQVLLYWFGLLLCTYLCVSCHRCATLGLLLQVGLGVFMYVYWFNFFNLWHRPRYHHTPSWPWTPSL